MGRGGGRGGEWGCGEGEGRGGKRERKTRHHPSPKTKLSSGGPRPTHQHAGNRSPPSSTKTLNRLSVEMHWNENTATHSKTRSRTHRIQPVPRYRLNLRGRQHREWSVSRNHSQSIARGVGFSHDALGVRVVSVDILRGDISSIFFGVISRRYFSW